MKVSKKSTAIVSIIVALGIVGVVSYTTVTDESLTGTVQDATVCNGMELKPNSNYVGKNFSGCTVSEQTNLKNSKLNKVKMDGSAFHDVNLNGVSLKNAVITESLLKGNIKNIDFSKAKITNGSLIQKAKGNLNFKDSDIGQLKITGSLENSNFNGATFTGTDLRRVDLSGSVGENADFSGTSFNNGDMSNVKFINSNFRNTNLVGVSIDGANFKGSDFTDAIWIDGTKCPDKTCNGKAY